MKQHQLIWRHDQAGRGKYERVELVLPAGLSTHPVGGGPKAYHTVNVGLEIEAPADSKVLLPTFISPAAPPRASQSPDPIPKPTLLAASQPRPVPPRASRPAQKPPHHPPAACRPPASRRPPSIPVPTPAPASAHRTPNAPFSLFTTALNRLAILKATSTCSVGAHYIALRFPACSVALP